MIPLGLRIGLVWLIETLMGKASPGRAPDRRCSVVAVIVSSTRVSEPLWLPPFPTLAQLAEADSLTILKLRVLLLTQLLELLNSLGAGLRGTGGSDSLGDGSSEYLMPEICSADAPFVLDHVLDFFETGSREITRGFGAASDAISMTSRRVTLLSHDMVGCMVVGRVRVEVII